LNKDDEMNLETLFKAVDIQLVTDSKAVQEISRECDRLHWTVDSVDPTCVTQTSGHHLVNTQDLPG